MVTLHQKQAAHVRKTAALILWAYDHGYELTWGQTLRTATEAAQNAQNNVGIKNSLHGKKLAVDLSLFKNGEYLTRSEDYKALGDYWKSLSEEGIRCCWGGDFISERGPDGNHFSIEHEGVR
jgi:hypothetical protein